MGLLEQIGERVAELDCALGGFDHPAIHRDFYWDLAKARDTIRELAPLVEDPAMRALVTRLASEVEARDGPRFARLRRAAAHNDPNDYNVLVALRPEFSTLATSFTPMRSPILPSRSRTGSWTRPILSMRPLPSSAAITGCVQ
jgi:Ser/Thr protein kinase RdoA (MazF antagonist)